MVQFFDEMRMKAFLEGEGRLSQVYRQEIVTRVAQLAAQNFACKTMPYEVFNKTCNQVVSDVSKGQELPQTFRRDVRFDLIKCVLGEKIKIPDAEKVKDVVSKGFTSDFCGYWSQELIEAIEKLVMQYLPEEEFLDWDDFNMTCKVIVRQVKTHHKGYAESIWGKYEMKLSEILKRIVSTTAD